MTATRVREVARRRVVTRTVPARLRIGAVLAAVAVLALFLAVRSGLGNGRDGLRVVGHDAGPQVVHTGDLYYALSDMDGQLASALLGGDDPAGREAYLHLYDQRRGEADRAVLEAFDIAGKDPAGRLTVQSVLDGLGRYERLASRALVLDEQSKHPPGVAPKQVLELYRQATDLMRLDLLPKAYNLTLESAAIVRETYAAERSNVTRARIAVGVTGVALLGVLVALQLYLTRRFRRIVNPALALTTVLALALTVTAELALGSAASHLREAKIDGFDSTLAYTRARAISNSAAGDQTRYLLDPERADTYEQVYLDKLQAIAFYDVGSLPKYAQNLAAADPKLGFLGGGPSVALDRFRDVEKSDTELRRLAPRDRAAAVRFRTVNAAPAFAIYDDELGKLISQRNAVFRREIRKGDDALDGWHRGLPVTAAVLIVLIALGVRPRLAEFR
ncbi:hypothetical protein [Actinocorallia longicatena]|uniref:Secreted protein n=1 Tax=Actinocorallia longicatena TaxID=111803 RepID=A0ABP6PYL1_9ACTN